MFIINQRLVISIDKASVILFHIVKHLENFVHVCRLKYKLLKIVCFPFFSHEVRRLYRSAMRDFAGYTGLLGE